MKKSSLKISVEELFHSEAGAKQSSKFEGTLAHEEDIRFVSPVSVKVDLSKLDEDILAVIAIKAKIELQCSRCGQNFLKNINYSSEEVFSRESEETERKISDDFIIDLEPVVREIILLNLPIKRLCKESCKPLDKLEVKE